MPKIKLCECGCGKETKIATQTRKSGAIKGQPQRFIKGHSEHNNVSDAFKFSRLGKGDPLGPPSHQPEQHAKDAKVYREENREKAKASALRSRLKAWFRITPEEQNKIEEYQRTHPTMSLLLGSKLATDHNHKTGLIRGRLEWRLNRAYGLIEKAFPNNTADVLRALAEFHDFPPAVTALGEERYGLIGLAQYKKKMIYGPPKEKQ